MIVSMDVHTDKTKILMSPELQERFQQKEQAAEIVKDVNPVSIIINFDNLKDVVSGTLKRMSIEKNRTKLTVIMLIDDALQLVDLINRGHLVGKIDVLSDSKDIVMLTACRVQKTVIKEINHVSSICHVCIDIAI